VESQLACACGATIPAGAPWCPRCLEPRSSRPAPTEQEPALRGFVPGGVAASLPPLPAPSRVPVGRFAKTDVSFGLRGRIVMTVLLLIPLAWFVYLAQWMIALGGLLIYAFIILPIALRDIWRRPRANLRR
jgi:hypothetical protein